jgi:hypothetical protein
MTSDLDGLLRGLDDRVRDELKSKPEVVEKGDSLDVDALPIEARRWHRLSEGVAVLADLKSSTQLGLNKHAASTASIYEAATGNVVRILGDFGADFVAIQGDGAFGLFWGDGQKARALTAGITIKTFSERHLVPRLEARWNDGGLPETGFKVGVAASPLLVKRVGLPRTEHQEPIWAGRAVNYAAKCAQQADRHEMVVTGSIWDWVSSNDYLAVSCGCGPTGSPSDTIWKDVVIDRLADDDPEREGRTLTSIWCANHGAEFCEAVLAGKRKRPDVTDQVQTLQARQMADAVRAKAAREREIRRQRNRAKAVR